MEQTEERLWHRSRKLNRFVAHRMIEAEPIGMKAQTPDGVVAIAIFQVATHGMPHVGCMDANLVFAPRLQAKFHQRMGFRAAKDAKVGYGEFPAIVNAAAVGEIGAVVLEPALQNALVALHHARQYGHISAVVNYVVPIVFQCQLCLLVLGINHQSAGVAVEAVNHVRLAVLATLAEVIVKYGFHVERAVPRRHRQDAWIFLHNHYITIFIDQTQMVALE